MAANSRLIRYWEAVFFLGYAGILCTFVIPELKWGFDGHDAALLMTSIRIWAGQVPFRDFYPWYGPLYHYLLAAFCGPLGNDLYAVKFYIDIISPLLSMMILILALRNFGLPAGARFFVLAASVFLGLERIYYCGSLRSFLPVFLISLLYRTYQKQQKLPYLVIFPAACVLFLFSPESGLYAMITSIFFVLVATLTSRFRKEKYRGAFYFAAGAGFGVLALALLYHSTGWFANYLEFVSVVSNNLYWSHGASMPSFREHTVLLAVFAVPLIYISALATIPVNWIRKGRPGQYSMHILTLVVLGALLASRTLIRFHETHMQFAFLPVLIIAGLLWIPPHKPLRIWKTALQVLLVLFLPVGRVIMVPFFPTPTFYGRDYKLLMGVRVNPQLAELHEKTKQQFDKLSLIGKVAIPLAGVEYACLGRAPQLPFDDLHYGFHPKYQQLLFDSLKKQNYSFLLISDEGLSWDFPQDSVDPFFDYIDANYKQILIEPPLHVYVLRKNPVNLIKVVEKEAGPFVLDRRNNYSFTLKMPTDFDLEFVEFKTNFKYRFRFLARLSMPIVEVYFDQKKWLYQRHESGRQRINPYQGDHSFRAHPGYPAEVLKVEITFPGVLNFAPEQIVVSDVRWETFEITNFSSRALSYELEK